MSLKSLKRHEGWLLIDHSASPGIPPDIAIKLGFDPKEVGEGATFEGATLTCEHCGGVWKKNPKRMRPRAYCRLCDHYICDGCDYLRSRPGYIHHNKRAIVDLTIIGA